MDSKKHEDTKTSLPLARSAKLLRSLWTLLLRSKPRKTLAGRKTHRLSKPIPIRKPARVVLERGFVCVHAQEPSLYVMVRPKGAAAL